jgi:3-deoxy-D-manno-octulosonate 8-phosphate phosphatase (KDO 8-P phosphatase)
MSLPSEEIFDRARHIHLFLMDCDGVLTDGSLPYFARGGAPVEDARVFHIHDGQGMRLASQAGLKLGIISRRTSAALAARAEEMKVDYLYQGISDKLRVYEQIKAAERLRDEQIAYIGDDLPDLAPMRRAGLAIAVADAAGEIRDCAHFVTTRNGGRGVVREAIELILKAQGKWEELLEQFNI